MANDDERLVILLEARIRDYEKNLAQASGTTGREFGKMRRTGKSAMDGMEQDVQRSTSRINQALAGTTAQIGSYGKAFAGGLVGGIAGAGLAGALSTIRDVAKGIATIGDEAKRAGLSARAFQELKFVADQNRVSIEALTDGMKELSLRADEFIVTGSGSGAEAFRRLGYDATTLKEKLKDPSALFTEIIGKLAQLDRAAQIRIADEIFGGTGGEQFVQLLDQGEKGIRAQITAAHDLGAVMSDELIAKAAELDRKFNQVSITVGNALKTAIVEAADALSRFREEFNRLDTSFQQRRSAVEVGGLMGSMAGGLTPEQRQAINDLEQRRAGIARDIERAEQGIANARDIQAPQEDIAFAEKQLAGLRQQLDAVQQQIVAQRTLNSEKERTVHLDQVEVQAEPQSSTGGRARFHSSRVTHALPDTAVIPSSGGGLNPYFTGEVEGSVRKATQAFDGLSGTVGRYVDQVAQAESGGRSNAKNPLSSATGLGQFIESTWLNLFRKHYPEESASMSRDAILGLRRDADVSRQMIEAYATENASILRQAGVSVNEAALHLAHFLGPQGAAKILNAAPGTPVSQLLDAGAIKANPTILGRGATAADVVRYGQNRAGIAASAASSGGVFDPWEGYRSATEGSKQLLEQNMQLQQSYEQLGQIGINALQGLANALSDGKLEGRELLSILMNVVQQLLAMPNGPGGGGLGILGSLFGGGSSAFIPTPNGFARTLGLPGFATGTANTGGAYGQPRGIVHGQEAVIPLPNGGKVPVHMLDGGGAGGDRGSSRTHVTVGVSVDESGNLQAYVKRVARQEGQTAASSAVQQYDKQLPDRITKYERNPRRRG